MAQLTGKIEYLGATTKVATKSNDTFLRRELVLSIETFDRFTGEVESENHPQFIFNGKNCEKLDGYQVGDMVTVDYVIEGRWYLKDGEKRNFTKVVGYNVQPYQRKQEIQEKPVEKPVEVKDKPQVPPTPPFDTLPF